VTIGQNWGNRASGRTHIFLGVFVIALTGAGARGQDPRPPVVQLVKDLNPNGSGVQSPGRRAVRDGILYFVGDNGATGRELFRSDGTPQGTYLVKDIQPGPGGSNPDGLIHVEGTLFFVADDGTHRRELWRSDGTPDGTFMVKDIYVPPPPWDTTGRIGNLIEFNNNVFFTALFLSAEGIFKDQVWRSDGTEAGTVPVGGPEQLNWQGGPLHLTKVGGTLFFSAVHDDTGRELWKSDGSSGGTVMIKDIRPGAGSAIASQSSFANVGGILFFIANTFGSFDSYSLWRSDGTAAGTTESSGWFDFGVGNITDVNGTVYFTGSSAFETPGCCLWSSNGDRSTTRLVKDMAAENLANIRGTLFLSGDDTHTLNNRLWKSNGTTEGTVPVCDDCGSPNWLTPVPDGLFLAADSSFQNTFQGVELVKSNGTASGNVLMDIVPGPKRSSPADLTRAGEMLFFTADDGVHGRELWVTRLGDTLPVANPGFEWSFVYGWRFSGQRPSLSTDSHSGFYAVEFGATFLSTKGMAALYQDLPVHSGFYAVEFGATFRSTRGMAVLYQDLPVVASADYRVSVWKKTLDADKSSFVVASFLRGDGSPIASYPFGHGPADRYALVQSQWLKAPAGAAKLRVALWRRPSSPRDFGRTLFDDVSVREQFQN